MAGWKFLWPKFHFCIIVAPKFDLLAAFDVSCKDLFLLSSSVVYVILQCRALIHIVSPLNLLQICARTHAHTYTYVVC